MRMFWYPTQTISVSPLNTRNSLFILASPPFCQAILLYSPIYVSNMAVTFTAVMLEYSFIINQYQNRCIT